MTLKAIAASFPQPSDADLNMNDIAFWIDNKDHLQLFQGMVSIRQIYDAAIRETITKLEILNSEFQARYDHNPIHHITSRLKTPRSMLRKLKERDCELSIASAINNLTDIAGVRVVCCYLDDVYRVAELLLRQGDISLIQRKDYIKNPKDNGYRSLHLVISLPVFLAESAERVPVEIQIRTEAMDFWASLEHQLRYKNDHAIDPDVHDELLACSVAVRELDEKMQSLHDKIMRSRRAEDSAVGYKVSLNSNAGTTAIAT
ncbi:MAG: GTP pyrophosphokinase family protein [Clostridiaceae bacterium]|nr:GTP pyrophosphokinase family protein [Clostridiaceae bacterium]